MASQDSDNPTSVFDSKLESILELLEEEDSQHFIYLTGAAGTGKTTLIERVKDECLFRLAPFFLHQAGTRLRCVRV